MTAKVRRLKRNAVPTPCQSVRWPSIGAPVTAATIGPTSARSIPPGQSPATNPSAARTTGPSASPHPGSAGRSFGHVRGPVKGRTATIPAQAKIKAFAATAATVAASGQSFSAQVAS